METLYFRLSISAAEYQAYYAGVAKMVSVIAEDGRRVEFSAEHLRYFVSHTGVYGRYALTIDANNKFQQLQRISV